MPTATITITGENPSNLKAVAFNDFNIRAAKLSRLAERLGVPESNSTDTGIHISYDYKKSYDAIFLMDAFLDKIEEHALRLL